MVDWPCGHSNERKERERKRERERESCYGRINITNGVLLACNRGNSVNEEEDDDC
jgi:hypothetical protein